MIQQQVGPFDLFFLDIIASTMVADTWETINKAPTARAAPHRGRLGTAAVNGCLYLCGGATKTNPPGFYLSTMEQYNPSTGTPWQTTAFVFGVVIW